MEKNRTIIKTIADQNSVIKIMNSLEDVLSNISISMKEENAITVATEEMYVNIVNYAYAPNNGKAIVEFETTDKYIKIKLTDWGKEFNPLKKETPDLTSPAEERNIGGLGIYMTRKMMDECHYERKQGKNIFWMIKYLGKEKNNEIRD